MMGMEGGPPATVVLRPDGTYLSLCLLAGLVVRLYSTLAAVLMAGVAPVIPPIAAIIANAGRENPDAAHRPGGDGQAPRTRK
jgi:hypothetical protein